MRLLLVEDDHDICQSLAIDLTQAGYVVDIAHDGEQGEFLGSVNDYAAAIIDLGLPKLPGLDVLRLWRQAGNDLPVIILTARDAWHEKVEGFNAGADDYLAKPFHSSELLARLQAVLKRVHQANQAGLQVDGIALDEQAQSVTFMQQTTQLTATEFRLLRYLMLNPGKLLSKSRLYEQIYHESLQPDSNVIEVYIKRLRKIIGGERIQTLRGQGYRFGESK